MNCLCARNDPSKEGLFSQMFQMSNGWNERGKVSCLPKIWGEKGLRDYHSIMSIMRQIQSRGQLLKGPHVSPFFTIFHPLKSYLIHYQRQQKKIIWCDLIKNIFHKGFQNFPDYDMLAKLLPGDSHSADDEVGGVWMFPHKSNCFPIHDLQPPWQPVQ